MAAWSLYGVFVGDRWGMTTNKREALRAAKEGKGYVRRMPYPRDTGSWDSPTFQVCSEPFADFRPAEVQATQPLVDLPSAPIGFVSKKAA